jgi:hypothetical protein
MLRRSLLQFAGAITVFFLATSARPAEIKIRFLERAIEVDGMSRAPISILLVQRDEVDYQWLVWSDVHSLVDADADGRERLELDRAVSPFTLCAAIDEGDGRFSVRGAGYIPRRLATVDVVGEDGLSTAVRVEVPSAEVMLVRPGKGTWFGRLGEGTSTDGDPVLDHQLTIASPRLGSDHQVALPGRLLPNDILIVVNPADMAVHAARIGSAQ